MSLWRHFLLDPTLRGPIGQFWTWVMADSAWNPKLTLKVNGLWIKIKAQNFPSQVTGANTLSKSEDKKEMIVLITGALWVSVFSIHFNCMLNYVFCFWKKKTASPPKQEFFPLTTTSLQRSGTFLCFRAGRCVKDGNLGTEMAKASWRTQFNHRVR